MTAEEAILAVRAGREVVCSAADWANGLRSAIYRFASACIDRADFTTARRAIGMLERLDWRFGFGLSPAAGTPSPTNAEPSKAELVTDARASMPARVAEFRDVLEPARPRIGGAPRPSSGSP